MAKRISFSIAKSGDVKINDVCGMGTSCQEATQDIEKLLGVADDSSRAHTDQMYQKADDLILKQDHE